MNEIAARVPEDLDGFDTYEDRVEGDEQPRAGGIIQGALVKFTNEATWEANGEELPADRELVAIDVIRVVQKWLNQQPMETRVLAPGQKFPDIEALNEATPRSEWSEGPNGEPRGPWRSQHLVYLLDPATMDRFSFPTGTIGGGIAVRELVDKIKWMRRFRGVHVYPVMTLSDAFMKNRFGGRQRPHFLIRRWIDLGGPPKEMALPAPVREPAALDQTARGARGVDGPKLAEQMNDEIPF